MKAGNNLNKTGLLVLAGLLFALPLYAQSQGNLYFTFHSLTGLILILFVILTITFVAALYLNIRVKNINEISKKQKTDPKKTEFTDFISTLNSKQIELSLKYRKKQNIKSSSGQTQKSVILLFILLAFTNYGVFAQSGGEKSGSIFSETGFIITLTLILIPVLAGIILMIVKVKNVARQYQIKKALEEADQFTEYLTTLTDEEVEATLRKREEALKYKLNQNELSGDFKPEDTKGLLSNIKSESTLPVVAIKKKAVNRPAIDPGLSKLILWYLACSAFWLLLGTTIGEYIGIKFVAPDADHVSWLSFGRLRPVHTNMVFWGWASLGMLGLGYYIVPRVSNAPLASLKKGWWALILINASVIAGTLCLMSGINNGGGEYREYIWPVMLLFAIGLVLTLINFLQTIAKRTTKEIYISNWYIVAATIFALVIVVVAYTPWWQDGLGETIIQGYYMHQGVGMWFMLFTLGIVYYFLPQQLNKPIYSYSLGILAFWTQILFYTVIGTHHFVFSSIPWWLQTVAIVGSVGMIIPVAAGTTNFIMTFKGAWYKLSSSYTLPFFLVGIIFYFTGSMQGTAEAFRSTNLYWHFTDFTVAHSHLTMYGIISFFLWAAIYAVVPRLTGKEAPQITVGAHFWLALIGLMFYTVPLMYGGTLKGFLWIEGKPFIDSLVLMAPYWLWRAIGGSLMWLSHVFFIYNMYKMVLGTVKMEAGEALEEKFNKDYLTSPTT